MIFGLQIGGDLIAIALHTRSDHFPRDTRQLADAAVAYEYIPGAIPQGGVTCIFRTFSYVCSPSTHILGPPSA